MNYSRSRFIALATLCGLLFALVAGTATHATGSDYHAHGYMYSHTLLDMHKGLTGPHEHPISIDYQLSESEVLARTIAAYLLVLALIWIIVSHLSQLTFIEQSSFLSRSRKRPPPIPLIVRLYSKGLLNPKLY